MGFVRPKTRFIRTKLRCFFLSQDNSKQTAFVCAEKTEKQNKKPELQDRAPQQKISFLQFNCSLGIFGGAQGVGIGRNFCGDPFDE